MESAIRCVDECQSVVLFIRRASDRIRREGDVESYHSSVAKEKEKSGPKESRYRPEKLSLLLFVGGYPELRAKRAKGLDQTVSRKKVTLRS
jgi:hypothetical protein